MEYRLNKQFLVEILRQWNRFLRKKIRLVACGGTALTLLGIKASTKDVDFMVPDMREYQYLISTIKDMGYVNTRGNGWQKQGEAIIFDLFAGKRIHTTELLDCPLQEGKHRVFVKLSRIDILVLNDYDLICSKMMRGAGTDFEDCIALLKSRRDAGQDVDMRRL